MRYYVSWKTTGYYRKDSLKLTARCPFSGCWPSCSLLATGFILRWIKITLRQTSTATGSPPPQFSAHVYYGKTVAYLSYWWALVVLFTGIYDCPHVQKFILPCQVSQWSVERCAWEPLKFKIWLKLQFLAPPRGDTMNRSEWNLVWKSTPGLFSHAKLNFPYVGNVVDIGAPKIRDFGCAGGFATTRSCPHFQ